MDASFEQLYAAYSRMVMAWLGARVEAAHADDLFQDVWLIFYGRWRRWEMLPEMEAPEARPVLSFLYRTAHFVLMGHRRRRESAGHDPIEQVEIGDGERGSRRMVRDLELGNCLTLAQQICPQQEFDVLLAKLAGVPAREIAATLAITEPVVDHHFRNSIARLRARLAPQARKGGRRAHAQA